MKRSSVKVVIDSTCWRQLHDYSCLLKKSLVELTFCKQEIVFSGSQVLNQIRSNHNKVPKSTSNALPDLLNHSREEERIELRKILQFYNGFRKALKLAVRNSVFGWSFRRLQHFDSLADE